MTERILKMPRLGETMDEGKVVGWLIKPGDAFKRGDPIIEIETDKTVAEFPALGDGRLEDVLAQPGETIAVGAPIARVHIGIGPDWTADDDTDGEPAQTPVPPTSIVDLAMPRLGETMEEGRLAKWLKAPGDRFERGEAIIEIETDKTVAEFPALMPGTLVEILRREDETVTVGEAIARIEIAAADAEPAKPPTGAPVAAADEPAIRPSDPATHVAPARTSGPVRATPLARRLARQHSLDIRTIRGTGRRARIEKTDVLAAVSAGAPSIPDNNAPADALFVDLPGGRMAYAEAGTGTGSATLLLHGFGGDRTTWAGIMSGLRRAGRRVIAPDLPGHGLTTIGIERADRLAADLPAFLDKVGAGARIDVVAHSLGAVAAMALASAVPERIATVTLIAPAGLGHEIDHSFIHGMANAASAGEVSHLLRRLTVQPVELSDTALSAIATQMAARRLVALADDVAGPSGQRVDMLGALDKLAQRLPVRILFGLQDRIIPWQQVTGVSPFAAIHLLARSGHMPQWDQTKDVLNILLAERS